MKRKLNNISDCQHMPLPPEPVTPTTEDTCGIILNALKPHTPSDQNKILEFVNNHIATARHDDYMKAREDERQAAVNLEKFMASTQGIQEFIKARQAAKDLSK